MSKARTIIIGGGLAGVTALYELARRRVPVTLLEADKELGLGASFANGGMLTASMSDPWNGPGVFGSLIASLFDPYAPTKLRLHAIPGLMSWGIRFLLNSSLERHAYATRHAFELAQRSVALTIRLVAELDIECAAVRSGSLKVFSTREAAGRPLALAEMLKPAGLRYESLSRDAVLEREPELREAREAIACGIFYPDDAVGDACAFLNGLARRAEEAGAKIKTGERVHRIRAERGRVVGVVTEHGDLEADNVIVATGFDCIRLTRPLGVVPAVKPAKGYSVTVETANWPARPRIPVVDDAMHAAIAPIGSRLRFVGTAEFAGVDRAIATARVDNLINLFARLYPHLAAHVDRRTAAAWSGLRPMSADGLPYIGAAGPRGLWLNVGHGHLGWTMAAGSAELLADQMLGDRAKVDARPFRGDR